MDPITTAIVAALAAGVTTGVTEVGKKTIVDAYNALKAILKRKLGQDSELLMAIQSLETKPDSVGRKTMVQEEVAATKADQDPEILGTAQSLLDKIEARSGGEKHVQTAIGSHIAQADRGGTATVKVSQSRE